MLSRIIRDPLAVFIALSALIFIASYLFSPDDEAFTIVVDDADITRLHDQWSMQMRRPPGAQEMNGLVEQFVKEEIYYREAARLGLDQNDTIVRRRLVQKLTFLTEDIATAAPPTIDDLQAHYAAHKDDYAIPRRISFKHRYFSSDRRSTAQSDAQAALADPEVTGDPFMLQREYAARSQREIGDLFGRAFAEALFALAFSQDTPAATPDAWQGPVESAYGWHAVLVTSTDESRIPPLDEVRDRVIVDTKQATRQAANKAYYEQLKAAYEVSYPQNFEVTESLAKQP